MRNPITPLGGTEMEILRQVWALKRATARDVHERIEATRPVAYTTVTTIIKKLADKGYLSFERDGATFVYTAARPAEEVRSSLLSTVVDKVFGGSARTLIQTLAGHESLTEAEQAEVHNLLRQLGDDAPATDSPETNA
ncbi:MAG: BlaI/MecI/CopY family transcriptional regulator [Rubricoccaceae bacterium]